MVVINVAHFVKLGDWATALTDYYYNKSESFPDKLTKKESKEILYWQLFVNGLRGEYEDGFFEASYELGEIYNAIYQSAKQWVSKNYPYLVK